MAAIEERGTARKVSLPDFATAPSCSHSRISWVQTRWSYLALSHLRHSAHLANASVQYKEGSGSINRNQTETTCILSFFSNLRLFSYLFLIIQHTPAEIRK